MNKIPAIDIGNSLSRVMPAVTDAPHKAHTKKRPPTLRLTNSNKCFEPQRKNLTLPENIIALLKFNFTMAGNKFAPAENNFHSGGEYFHFGGV